MPYAKPLNRKMNLGGFANFNPDLFNETGFSPTYAVDKMRDQFLTSNLQGLGNINTAKDNIAGVFGEASKGLGSGLTTGLSLGTAFGGIGAVPGAIIGGLVGLGGGLLKGFGRRRRERKALEADANALQESRMKGAQYFSDLKDQASRQVLESFPTQGYTNQRFFKYGGITPSIDIKGRGGFLSPLGKKTFEVIGDTHNQDSDLDGRTGVSFGDIELEKGEIAFEDQGQTKIVSKALGFADKAKAMIESPMFKKFEKATDLKDKLKGSNFTIDRNTVDRLEKTLSNPLNKVFKEQEDLKARVGLNDDGTLKFSNGGVNDLLGWLSNHDQPTSVPQDYSNSISGGGAGGFNNPYGVVDALNTVATVGASFSDNLVNRKLINSMPQIPNPILTPAVQLETEHNNRAELQGIKNIVAAGIEDVNRNSSSPGAGNIRKRKLLSMGMDATSRSNQNKANIERDLRNKNKLNVQAVNAGNVATLNDNALKNMLRLDEKAQRISRNVADSSTDALAILRQGSQFRHDKKALEVLALKYKATGVMDRNAPPWLKALIDAGLWD